MLGLLHLQSWSVVIPEIIDRANGAFGRQVEKRFAWINDGEKRVIRY